MIFVNVSYEWLAWLNVCKQRVIITDACESDNYEYFTADQLCLMFFTQQMNWTNAREHCQQHDGILVVKGSGDDKINAVLEIYDQKKSKLFILPHSFCNVDFDWTS